MTTYPSKSPRLSDSAISAAFTTHIALGTDTFLKILTQRGGGQGYCDLARYAIHTLRQLDVSDYEIRQ